MYILSVKSSTEQGAYAVEDEEGKRVENEIKDNGGVANFIKCDVGDEKTVNSAVEAAADLYGKINILFNNAGHGAAGDFPNSKTEDWNTVINNNLNGTFFVSRAVWPIMEKSGGGAIVNMSSLAAQRGFSPKMKEVFGTTAPSYYVAKAGIDALTRYMAGVGGDKNIRVNCLSPGGIYNKQDKNFTKKIKKLIPLNRMAHKNEYNEVIQFLCSDASSYMTGQNIIIDGGRTII